MPEKKWYTRWYSRLFGILFLLLLSFLVYLVVVLPEKPPAVQDRSSLALQRSSIAPGTFVLKKNWFRKSKSGLYELYVEGNTPFELGVIDGKLTKELVVRQEDHFVEQISKLLPSLFYRHFLKYFVAWFNRHLADNIPLEYRQEIYGISLSASDQYQYIGSNYQRLLNYHAAHDIGHALQSMALVGCTSFGTWGSRSEDGTMIIGRNFDFYVGDKFAEDKIVSFIHPAKGYRLMTITWGGFIGAVSGMNEKGLAVTINAAKSGTPSGSATPVSLVAREILQYAKNIQEAYAIAQKRKMFVSESFLISSAEDHKAVIFEKTPESLAVYDPGQESIVCANHFQSRELSHSKENLEQLDKSASAYRYQRVEELMKAAGKNTVEKTISILRNYKGLHDADIGLGNEKAINQFLAHHAIVFEPEKRRVWVSTSPWQLGEFVSYDLAKIFAMDGLSHDMELMDDSLTVPADSFLTTKEFSALPSIHEIQIGDRSRQMGSSRQRGGQQSAILLCVRPCRRRMLPRKKIQAGCGLLRKSAGQGDRYEIRRRSYPRQDSKVQEGKLNSHD
jgi:hypothetical protein